MKTILEHNVETGETIEREMNADELASYKLDEQLANEKIEAEATKAAEKSALLERLGLTEDEAKLLLL